MSYWTHISGVITVKPMGRTQPEKRYILYTVLEHLPYVTGSEGNMAIQVVQLPGYDGSCSHNEFDEPFCNRGCKHKGERGATNLGKIQSTYMLIISGDLRDRMFDETLHELSTFLNRLAKRIHVTDILVKLTGDDLETKRSYIISDYKPYQNMFENPSWNSDHKEYIDINWCEYLMWDAAKDDSYPMKLMYKYFYDPENDKEVERRMDYERRN